MIDEIIAHRPLLAKLACMTSVRQYLEPAFTWNPTSFPYRESLTVLLCEEARRLYGLNEQAVFLLEKQFASTWSVQTGEHVCIPRVRERPNPRKAANGMELPSHNPMIYQGVVYWAATSKVYGYDFSLALATGRVPLNNPLAGTYLEISAEADLIRLAPEAWHQVPQILVPAISGVALDAIKKKINNVGHLLSSQMDGLFQQVVSCFELNNASFTDQIASAQSLIMSKTMPIRQLTIESENIAVGYLIQLLSDCESLIARIFSDSSLRLEFLQSFSGINTGWSKNGSPFYKVVNTGKFPKLAEYAGSLEPKELLPLLRQGIILPKGVMKFFTFMIEGGLLPVGGISQNIYCSEIKRRAISFLNLLGEKGRACELTNMPTEIATITPCWRTDKLTGKMMNVLDCLSAPLDSNDLFQILEISGAESIVNAAPVLYPFLTGKSVDLGRLLKYSSLFSE